MKQSKTIWIVEDDAGSQFVYNEILGIRYELRLFNNLASFRKSWDDDTERKPDLMIIDLHLPDQSFLSFLQTESGREMSRTTPYMIVSSLDDLDALRVCYDEGAIDYISKPFAKSELIVKVERILATPKGARTRSNPRALFLDPTTFTLTREAGLRSEELTAKEYKILAIMLNSKDFKITRKELQEQVWGEALISNKSLDQHFFHLRKKISPLGLEIMYIAPVYRLV